MPAAPSICLVGTTIDDVRSLADRFTSRGWPVRVLLVEGRGKHGAAVTYLEDLPVPEVSKLEGPLAFPHIRKSDQVRWALNELHQRHRFDAIVFADRHAAGFRSVQARRLGLDLIDVTLVAVPQDSTRDRLDREGQWLCRPDQLANEHAERYIRAHADALQVTGDPRTVLRRPMNVSSDKPIVTVAVAYYNLAAYLEETLDSLARQTYPAIEVIVLDDGSTDAEAGIVFDAMRVKYPAFHFHRQTNQGIGATRNRGLELASGKYFLPMDADNIARPDMIERLVNGLERCPELSALSCYFLAFRDSDDLAREQYSYAYRPTGGPHLLAAQRNVYGDACSLFRRDALRAIGGFTTDRQTSYEDWELFVRLVNAGHEVDVLPEYLLHYRHRDAGFSRQTSDHHNHLRVLRQYFDADRIDGEALWTLLAGLQQRVDDLEREAATTPRSALTRRLRRMWSR